MDCSKYLHSYYYNHLSSEVIMEKWIERHGLKILFTFGIIFAIEIGIWCWRMPEDFRSNVIPKLESQFIECAPLRKDLSEIRQSINVLLGMERQRALSR